MDVMQRFGEAAGSWTTFMIGRGFLGVGGGPTVEAITKLVQNDGRMTLGARSAFAFT